MRRTRWTTLLGIVLGVGAISWVGLSVWNKSGILLPAVPWLLPILLVLCAIALFVFGWSVRQYQRGNRPDLSMIRASRILAFAKAACYAGAFLAGLYLASGLVDLEDISYDFRKDRALRAAVAFLSALILMISGYIVEWFCQLPPPDDEKSTSSDPAAPA